MSQTPSRTPARQPFGGPARQPFGGPARQPFGGPARQPFGGPARQPFGGPARHSPPRRGDAEQISVAQAAAPKPAPVPRSCRSCLHRRRVVSLFDTGQLREVYDCAWLIWPSPVSPGSLDKNRDYYVQYAANCPHYSFGAKSDLVVNELE